MLVTVDTRQMLRAAAIYCGCLFSAALLLWLTFHYGVSFFPHKLVDPVFMFLMACLFPYDESIFGESLAGILIALHWALSAGAFMWFGRRLSVGRALLLVAAFILIVSPLIETILRLVFRR